MVSPTILAARTTFYFKTSMLIRASLHPLHNAVDEKTGYSPNDGATLT